MINNKSQLLYIIISHDLAVEEYICDRIAVMYLGKIVEMAAYRDTYADPKHPYTQDLLSAAPVPNLNAKSKRIILEITQSLNMFEVSQFANIAHIVRWQ